VRILDASGHELLTHTEGAYDFNGRAGARTGPQPVAHPPARMTDADYEAQGSNQELNGQRLQALATYQEGLKAFPESCTLARAAGRLLVGLKQFDAAVPLLTMALARVSNDRESAYYLGLAQRASSPLQARTALESAEQYGPHRAASLFALAGHAARDGDRREALRLLGDAMQEAPLAVRIGGMQVALLRAAGRTADARQALVTLRRTDPTNSLLRHEAVCLGGRDDGLWAHLAADPERILELVVDYQRFGLYDDALAVLSHAYPSGPEVVSEPGMPAPASYPLLAYYRGYIRSLKHEAPAADYAAASAMPTTYVFPHRAESLAVLRDAVTRNPEDPTAHFLLGSLYLSGGMVDEAMKAWESARALRPGMATLHRNMGYTLLQRGDVEQAIAVFREGTTHDAANEGVYTGLEAALARGGRPAAERADALLGFPDQRKLPAALVYKLATALAEAGRFDEAERQFAGRFFPREEGGINVRQIWLDVRVRRALALATGGDCRAATGIASALGRPVAGLAFTQDGLEDILGQRGFQERLEAIRTTCGSAASILDADVPYGIGDWDADTYGNHRAVVRVDAAAPAVRVHLPWRRWDPDPAGRHLIVVHASSDRRITNVARPSSTRESGDIVFEAPGAGTYFVYYLPYVGSGRTNYPTVTYPGPQDTADPAWLARHGLTSATFPAGAWRLLPDAAVTEFQAVEELHSFFPMLVAATSDETAGLLAQHPQAPYLVFPEDRTRPIKMPTDLPLRWIRRGANGPVSGDAQRGEFYVFQVGVFAARQALDDVRVEFGSLSRSGGGRIPASALRCFNRGGIDSAARPFTRTVAVAQGHVQSLWCGIDIPASARAGEYRGEIVVAPAGAPRTTLPVMLRVLPTVIAARGDDEPWRLSRLRWLDSVLAVDDELVAPFTPVTVSGSRVGVLGRSVTLDALGFPAAIESRFAVEMTHLVEQGRRVLTGPIALVASGASPDVAPWTGRGVTFTKQQRGAAAWRATATGGALTLATQAQMDFDGNMEYAVTIGSTRPTPVDDIRLEIPIADDIARYLMGLGFKGG
ncbi:MAG: DUF6067 family protein, partial [Vicinamibacterales bacterium]|nr:DUF6067 family protein [Vicinamibacterales bacterium]